MSQLDGDGVIVRGVVVTVVRYAKRLGHHRSFNAKSVFGVFFDVVQEKSFNPALMQDDLLETRKAHWYIWYASGTMDYAVFIWVLLMLD
jgi:hypothetical protein